MVCELVRSAPLKKFPSKTHALGVEFEGHSDTGYNAGLNVVKINTQRDGQTIPVISLCEVSER